MSVTKDATKGWYIPQSSTEWTALLAGSGLVNPVSAYGCQDPNTSLADLIGSRTLTAHSSPLFQQPTTGWSSKAIKPRIDSNDYFVGSVLDQHTHSMLLMLVLHINAVSQLSMFSWTGGGSPNFAQELNISAIGKINLDLNGGAADANGNIDLIGTDVVLALQVDITNNVARVFVNGVETLTPTWQGVPTVSSGLLYIGGAAYTWPDANLMYAAYWADTGAEMSSAQVNTLISRIKLGPPSSKHNQASGHILSQVTQR